MGAHRQGFKGRGIQSFLGIFYQQFEQASGLTAAAPHSLKQGCLRSNHHPPIRYHTDDAPADQGRQFDQSGWRFDQNPSQARSNDSASHRRAANALVPPEPSATLGQSLMRLDSAADGLAQVATCPLTGDIQGLADVHHLEPARQLAARHHVGRGHRRARFHQDLSPNWQDPFPPDRDPRCDPCL
jgi:hypothetical protein